MKTLFSIAIVLIVFLTTGATLAQQGAWSRGKYQLLTGPPSGPLKATMTGRASLGSYKFVGGVGGVAFAAVARPAPQLADSKVHLTYEPTNPDGVRLSVVIDDETRIVDLYDWMLIPIARYADSPYNASVSLFGDQSSDKIYDIVYHPALQDTLLGLRLLQADILLFDLRETWQLPKYNGRHVIGKGETVPDSMNIKSALAISSAIQDNSFQSWVLTDQDETVTFKLTDHRLRLSGLPYYYFWNSDIEQYQGTVGSLSRRADELLKQGRILEHNSLVAKANAMVPKVREVVPLTTSLKRVRRKLREFNPAVYDAATAIMRYAALFRYVKRHNPKAWQDFLRSIRSVDVKPAVRTPTKWPRPR